MFCVYICGDRGDVRMLCVCVKPWTDIASKLLAIYLRLDIGIACNGFQQKFQHAEYFTCNPLISLQICI